MNWRRQAELATPIGMVFVGYEHWCGAYTPLPTDTDEAMCSGCRIAVDLDTPHPTRRLAPLYQHRQVLDVTTQPRVG